MVGSYISLPTSPLRTMNEFGRQTRGFRHFTISLMKSVSSLHCWNSGTWSSVCHVCCVHVCICVHACVSVWCVVYIPGVCDFVTTQVLRSICVESRVRVPAWCARCRGFALMPPKARSYRKVPQKVKHERCTGVSQTDELVLCSGKHWSGGGGGVGDDPPP